MANELNDPYKIAKEQGYTDDEIQQYLQSQEQYKLAKNQGYTDIEISEYLKSQSADKTLRALDSGYSIDEIKIHVSKTGLVTPLDDDNSLFQKQFGAQLEKTATKTDNLPYIPREAKSDSIFTPYTEKTGVIPEAVATAKFAGLWLNAMSRSILQPITFDPDGKLKEEQQNALKQLTDFGEKYEKPTLDVIAGIGMIACAGFAGIAFLKSLPTKILQTPGIGEKAQKISDAVKKAAIRGDYFFNNVNKMSDKELGQWIYKIPESLRGHLAKQHPRVMDFLKKVQIDGRIGFVPTGQYVSPDRIAPHQTTSFIQRTVDKYTGYMTDVTQALIDPKAETNALLDAFTKYRGLTEGMQQNFYAVQELKNAITKTSVEYGTQLTKSLVGNVRKEFMCAYEENTPLPPGTEDLAREMTELGDNLLERYSNMGHEISRFPDNKIEALVDKKAEFVKQLTQPTKDTNSGELEESIKSIDDHIKKLEKLKYLHRITHKAKGIKASGLRKGTSKKISTTPYHFMGRAFDTARDAEAAGYEVGDIAAVVAESIRDVTIAEMHAKLIGIINNNPEISAEKGKGLPGWEPIDVRLMPTAKGKVYHPVIKNAIEQLTWTSKDSNIFLKAYDALNTGGKIISLYNPPVMLKNDFNQGFTAAGCKMFAEIPKAIIDTVKNTSDIQQMEAEGYFSTGLDYQPAVEEMCKTLLIDMQSGLKGRVLEQFKRDVNPVTFFKDVIKGLQNILWTGDKIIRVATRRAMDNRSASKGKSSFLKTREADIFMAAYGTTPDSTRHALNRGIFTPTYKISTARLIAEIHAHPQEHWDQLLRYYAQKAFFKYVLPGIAANHVINKYTKQGKSTKDIKAYSEGHKIVVQDENKETVWSFSAPVLEATKVAQRKPSETMYFNLAAVPQALMAFMNKNKSSMPKHELERMEEYTKMGIPGVKEWKIWHEKDATSAEKWMQTMGIAYMYTRDKYKYPDKNHSVAYEILDTMDLIPKWFRTPEQRKAMRLQSEYNAYQAELKKAYKDNDIVKIADIQKRAKEKEGLNIYKTATSVKQIKKEQAIKKTKTRDESLNDKLANEVKRLLNGGE